MRIISKHRWERLQPFEKMDPSIPGGSRFLVVTHSSELAHQGWHQSNRIPIGLELFLIFGLSFFSFTRMRQRFWVKRYEELQASSHAFAAILTDGCVVCWGNPDFGGCCRVQTLFQNVLHFQASLGAFDAILEDASVNSWGKPLFGGDALQ